MSDVLRIVDLFAGAGGTTTGVLLAAEELGVATEAVAVNHWPTAVATHTENHRQVRHYCADIQAVDPSSVVPSGRLDLLWASPECTHHSRARGGKPVSEQKRSGADWVLDWLEALDVRCLILENVEEWLSWGDVEDGKPVSKTRGKLFVRWWNRLTRLGYRAEYRVLNAADYGDATTRRRLFVQARKDGKPLRWPEPTHRKPSKAGAGPRFDDLPPWRPAREILDWSDLGPSLFERAKPLSLKTRLRIARGLRRYAGVLAPHYIRLLDLPAEDEVRILERPEPTGGWHRPDEQLAPGVVLPFLWTERENSLPRSVDVPVGTITTSPAMFVTTPTVAPFTFANREHGAARGPDEPVATATTATGGGMYLASPRAEPFVLGQQSDSAARPTDQPIPTVATAGAIRLFSPQVRAFLDVYYGNGVADGVEEPLSTTTTKPRHALVSPLVVPYGPRAEARSAGDPLPTVMTKDRLGVASPLIVQIDQSGSAGPGVKSIDDPLATLVTKANRAVASPFAVPFYGERPGQQPRIVDLDEPLDAVTTAGRFALVAPIASWLTPKLGERPTQEPRTHDVEHPLPTVTGEGAGRLTTATLEEITAAIGGIDPRRLVWIDGVLCLLDIRFRMLFNHELAAAMGFPDGYRFSGTKTDVTKQIGNAVCVGVARALVLAMFGGDATARRAS